MKTYILYDIFTPEGFYLTQGYGVNASTYAKYGLLWHEGVDFGDKTDPKPKVRAAHDGIVVQDWDTTKGNYGEYIVIWDDVQNCATWYCHLEENYVEYGQRVKAGDVIGIMGATGNVTGKHLHFNFVQTDSSGARSHNTKAKNLGFLDPQLPFDLNITVFPPGVAQYKVEWKPVPTSPGTMPDTALDVCLKQHTQLVTELEAEKKKTQALETQVKLKDQEVQRLGGEVAEKASALKTVREELVQFMETLAGKLTTIVDKSEIIGVVDRLIAGESEQIKKIKNLEDAYSDLETEKKLEIEQLKKSIDSLRIVNETQAGHITTLEKRIEAIESNDTPTQDNKAYFEAFNKVVQAIKNLFERK